MNNIIRGQLAILSLVKNENLVQFGEKHHYSMNFFSRPDLLYTALKAKKYVGVIVDTHGAKFLCQDLINRITNDFLSHVIVFSDESDDAEKQIGLLGIQKTFTTNNLTAKLMEYITELTLPPVPDTGVFEDDFCGMAIDDIIYINYCPFDVYCRLSESKAVKIINAYEQINLELVNRLKEKGVSRLFLKRNDYKKLIAINAYATVDEGLSGKEKLRWINSATQILLDDLYHEEITMESFFAAKQVVESTLDLVADNSLMFQLINSLNQLSDDVYKHALGMSVYSVLIASKLKMNSPKTKFRLSIAGLLADVGVQQIDPVLLNKSRILYNFQENQEYNKHTDYSVNILRAIDGLPEEILQIVSHHHENLDGSGFPKKIMKNNIHPLARILRVADEFCFLTLRTKHNRNVMTPIMALQEMKKPYNSTKFCKETLVGLEKLLLGEVDLKAA